MMNQQQRNAHAEYMAQRVSRGSYMQQVLNIETHNFKSSPLIY